MRNLPLLTIGMLGQMLTVQFKVEMEKGAKSKLGAEEVAKGLKDLKSMVTAVLQDSLMLISEANKREQAMQAERQGASKFRK